MFGRLLSLIEKEFLSIWRDPKSRAIIIIPPLLQLFIFANALTLEVKNVDMMVLDKSKTQESRELIAHFENSRWFRSVIKTENIHDIDKYLELQKMEMGVIIDESFAVDLKKEKPANIQVILDGRNTRTAAIVNGYVIQIASKYSDDLARKAGKKGAKITVETRNWFNPNLEFQWYLVTSLIAILALVITLNLTALSIARERELGTFDQLIVSPYTSLEILAGKTVPPMVIALALVSIMSLIAVFHFKIPFTGSFILFLVSVFISLLSFVGIGLFISSICRNQQQAILGAFSFIMPAILLSGYISPIEDMPVLVQYLTYLNPIRFFMVISHGIFLKNMPFIDVCYNLIPLVLVACLTLIMASKTFKRNLE